MRFGFNIIRGDILDSAKYGVWSYHHDDEQKYRGGPPCFWEIYHQDPVNAAILQKLTNRLDAGVILYKGFFPTFGSYSENMDRVYFGAADWCRRVCKKIVLGQTETFDQPPVVTKAPIYLQPTNSIFLSYLVSQSFRKLKRLFTKLFGIEIWNVGLIDRPALDVVDSNHSSEVKWFQSLGNKRFIADPFYVATDKQQWILVEDFDYKTGKGHVSQFEFPDGFTGDGELSTAIDADDHLSYPSIIQDNGRVYCVPENLSSGELRLFKLNQQQTEDWKWEFEQNIFDTMPMTDPTFFFVDNRWWIFCLDGDNNHTESDLLIFHAEKIAGPWIPHELNPVKSDVRNSRPAGAMFRLNGKIFRPAQDSSECYGSALALNEVTKLSPTEFEEKQVGTIRPNKGGKYPIGLHTLVTIGDKTVIDGKRIQFGLFNPFTKIWQRIRR